MFAESIQPDLSDLSLKHNFDFEVRKPIIDEDAEKEYSIENIDKIWGFLSEKARREILSNPELRKEMIQFNTQLVSETLPIDFIHLLEKFANENNLLKNYFKKYKKFIEYLKIPPIPDENITPDIRHTSRLRKPEDIEKMFWENPENFQRRLGHFSDAGVFVGITEAERKMAVNRYKFARDVKRLSLIAEVVENNGVKLDEKGKSKLPSGIEMAINKKIMDDKDLINPLEWKKRKQTKDRVYEIEIGTKKYFLKEKKTARHTDTKQGGHIEGLSSAREFTIAEYFQKYGTTVQNNIKLSWERPVGYVRFPDGFQFTIFEYEKNLLPEDKTKRELYTFLKEHPQQFQEEYKEVENIMQKLFKTAENLSYEEFAIAKTIEMLDSANLLMQQTIYSNGFQNSDRDGYAFRINNDKGFKLEMIGFDFEYFSKYHRCSPEDTRRDFMRNGGWLHGLYWDLEFVNPEKICHPTKITNYAYLSLLLKDKYIKESELDEKFMGDYSYFDHFLYNNR